MNLEVVPFNLEATVCCGQVFRWEKVGDWWYGVCRDRVFKVRQTRSRLEYANVDEAFVKRYFSLDVDFQAISGSINKDEHIAKALKAFWGLRLIRQDPWECLISYICAAYKSIPAIRHMLNNLARKFGERTTLDGMGFYTFPEPGMLAAASEKDLAECGLGYRAKYVSATSRRIAKDDFNLEGIRRMPYMEAKKGLCEFPGVGPKVADCVLLFSLDKLEAFPVDVWMRRVILNHYADKLPVDSVQRLSERETLSNADYERLNSWGRKYFGEYAGYAQEYLYHYERMKA
ncbi:MAG: DNA-3-methyladenine glycosylase [Candidatus Bathyarchaeia archaeon]